MDRYRPRRDSSPRSASRHQTDMHRGRREASPRSERERVRFSGDTYRPSPRSPRQARSPANMRHSFIPERRPASPTHDSYRTKPGPRRRDARRPSPTRRSSASASTKGQSSSVMSPKSPNVEDKDPRTRNAMYRNPTLDKPAASSPTDAPANIEYSVFKNVPRGPAKSGRQPAGHTPVPEHVKRGPHIFISSQHLPVSIKTVTHLRIHVMQHQPIDILIDDSGYYLRYPNSAIGRLTLRQCKEEHDGELLLSMYTLVMQAFVDGQPGQKLTLGNNAPAFTSAVACVGTQENQKPRTIPPISRELQAHTQVARSEDPAPNHAATTHISAKTSDPRLRDRASQTSISDPAQSEPSFAVLEDDAFLSASRSSPPRGNTRNFHDDAASSASSRTSEVSTSGRSCHVCKQRIELDNLARCSTCARRYHRYCHTRMPLPATLGPAWQCQRCLEKKVPSKRTLNDSFDGDAADIFDSLGPPAAKKTKLNNAAVDSSAKDHDHARATAGDVTALNHGCPVETSTGMDTSLQQRLSHVIVSAPDRTVLESTVPVPLETPASALPTEADDLVEQAFNSSNGPDNAPKKPVQLTLARRKAKVGPARNDLPLMSHELPDPRQVQDSTTNGPVEEEGNKAAQSPVEMPTVDTEWQRHDFITSADEQVDNGTTTTTTQEVKAANQNPTKRDSSASLPSAPDSSRRVKAQHIKHIRVDCAGCGKIKVPRAPSGRMLCVQCKRKDGALSTRDAAVVAPAVQAGSSTRLPVQPSSRPELQQVPENTTVPAIVSAKVPVDHAGLSIPLLTDVGEDGQVASEPACRDCRRRHRKCKHRSRSRPSTMPCQACRRRRIRCEHGPANDEEDDLDFWSNKLPSTCEQCGGTHDPMQCPVQSFPAAEALSASDELFAVIARSQDNGLWSKGTDPSQALASTQLENRKGVERELQPPINQALSQVNDIVDAPRPSSQPERTGLKRKSQRRAAVNEDDLGDSHARPQGTFPRLIGMALCDAPGNRSDPAGVVTWVDQNIPGYDKSQGTWSKGLKATMILNSQGKSGTPRVTQVIEGGRKLYQLLPHMVDTHERWNHELQQPVVPEGVHRPLDIGVEDDMDDYDSDLEDAALAGPPQSSAPVKETKAISLPVPSRGGRPIADGEVEVDNADKMSPTVDENGVTGVYDSSKDEPLATQQSRFFVASTAPMATFKSSLRQDTATNPTPDGSLYHHGVTRGLQLPDQLLLRALIRDELENQNYCAKTLEDEWPELHPDFQMDKKAKLAEIKARPRKKAMFGRAPNGRTGKDLNNRQSHTPEPFPVLGHDPFPGAQNDEEEDGTKSKRCKALEDFLDVPDDLEPHILEKELVYRHCNSRIRTVYKTGI